MISKHPSYYLEEKEHISSLSLQDIDELIERHPFWHLPYLLKVAKQKSINLLDGSTIEHAAIRCPDPFQLEKIVLGIPTSGFGIYNLSDFTGSVQNEEDTVKKEMPENEATIQSFNEPTKSKIEAFQDLKVESKILEEQKFDLKEENQNVPLEQDAVEEELLFITSFPSNLKKRPQNIDLPHRPIIIFEGGDEEEKTLELALNDIPEGNKEVKSSEEKISKIKAEVIHKDEIIALSPFAQWLISIKSNSSKETEDKTSATETSVSSNFEMNEITATSNIKKKKKKSKRSKKKKKKKQALLSKEKAFDPVKSLTISSDIISESLANLYAKQGLNQKAIQMYKALSLRFPEKSNFFAVKIQKLEKN